MIFMKTQKDKTNEPYKLAFDLSKRLDLISFNKDVVFQNLSIN